MSEVDILVKLKVEHEFKDGGRHIVVSGRRRETIDFWPGTKLWIVRGGKRGSGLRSLLARLGFKKSEMDAASS